MHCTPMLIQPTVCIIKADKAQLASKIFTGTITSDVTLQPEQYPDMKNRKGNGEPPMAFRPRLPAVCVWMMFLLICRQCPSQCEGDSNIGLDMKIVLGPKVHLYVQLSL